MSRDNLPAEKEIKQSLNMVIIAVTFGITLFAVINGPILTAYTRALGAGDFVYAVIMAMPVVGAILQVFASYFLERTGKRKKVFLLFGFIHRLVWIPIAVIPFLIPENLFTLRIIIVTLLIAVAACANSICSIAFNSWMGSLVPMEIRGRFFSKRTMIYTISSGIASLVASRFVDVVPGFKGYMLVFIIVAIFGTVDIAFFIWIKHPPMAVSQEKTSFFRMFFEPFKNKNYMYFTLFISLWYFAVNFAGPFFNVYMLEHLKMKLFIASICGQVISNVSTVLFIRFWGKIADKFGNKPVLLVCCIVIISLPFMWLVLTPQNYWLILGINFIGGTVWPGVELTVMNMSIWLAPEKNRSMYIANYTLVMNVVGVAVAYLCGGAFMQVARPFFDSLRLPFIFGQTLNSFHILFVISGLIRIVVLVTMFRHFGEDNSKSAGEMLKSINTGIKKKVGINS